MRALSLCCVYWCFCVFCFFNPTANDCWYDGYCVDDCECEVGVLRLATKSAFPAAGIVAGFTALIIWVIRSYGAVRDMISTAKLRLTVKPMFKNSVKSAEPIPCLSCGTELYVQKEFGFFNQSITNIQLALMCKRFSLASKLIKTAIK